jgi:hypothetical protein
MLLTLEEEFANLGKLDDEDIRPLMDLITIKYQHKNAKISGSMKLTIFLRGALLK